MPAYLTESSNAAARSYAVGAASDKQITYSISSNTDAVLGNWIDRIYEYVGKLINVTFTKVESGGEFRVSLEQPDYQDLYPQTYVVKESGLIRWSSVHNTMQYGGVNDQRTLIRAIGNSLGLSKLDWRWKEAGNTGSYTTYNTIMSEVSGDPKEFDFGHTVFFGEDDKNSLKEIYGSNKVDAVTGATATHTQRIKEDLLIGANGQIDTFRLIAKGMNASNKDSIWHDPATGWDWVCDYNIPTIVNFNPDEGDRILIDRRLYMPLNPISPETPTPKKIQINGKSVKTSKYLKKIQIDFVNQGPGDAPAELSTHNTIFNDAGKLMLNVNGATGGYGPEPVTGNGQLLAFVDIAGSHPTTDFQAGWLDLF